MTKKEFSQLFEGILTSIASEAEERLGRVIPKSYQIALHGWGHSGTIFSVAAALDVLFISEDLFYRIIDVAVIETTASVTTFFVRISSHEPASFDQTWNTPKGHRPFKHLIAERIKEW
jgi:hypothetical protein